MRKIQNLVAFPTDAESSPFFGALATVFLPALGYGEGTPYFCSPKGAVCVRCGGCGEKTTLQKHHLQLYHDFITRTGVALGWSEPEGLGVSHAGLDDGFMGHVMDIAGLSWKKLSPADGRETVLRTLAEAIDAGFPALLKLGDGRDWHVAAGYDEAGRLYGLDSHAHHDETVHPTVRADAYAEDGWFTLSEWFAHFRGGVAITGRGPSRVTLSESLSRMIRALEDVGTDALEREVMEKIDDAAPENAFETAVWLNHVAGFPIEARWHVASCTDSTLQRLTENRAAHDKLFAVTRQYVFDSELAATHGTCWKIWGLLGVGPTTGYAVTSEGAAGIASPDVKAELKRLFGIVFENDRIVLGLLRDALSAQ